MKKTHVFPVRVKKTGLAQGVAARRSAAVNLIRCRRRWDFRPHHANTGLVLPWRRPIITRGFRANAQEVEFMAFVAAMTKFYIVSP